MNEEMRKEFEEFIFDFLGKDVAGNRSKTPNGIDGYVFDDDNSTALCTVCWMAWQASRESMKPIELPKKYLTVIDNECHYYNTAIEECENAIQQAGYKVAP